MGEQLVPDAVVIAFALSPGGDVVDVTYVEPNLDNHPSIQKAHSISVAIQDVEGEYAEVQEALAALVDKLLLLDRRPPDTIRSRRG